ncbi:MAG TPA: histidinol dehydrogenase, partial [Methylophilaceae bacterium]|nr:histidinol dehydrogenase [Methylophilaceae bacterium]
MVQIKKLNTQDLSFEAQLRQLIFFEAEENTEIEKTVAEILNDVKKRGDQAVIEYTKKFDHVNFSRMEEFEISKEELNLALESLPKASKDALEEAAKRVFDYHNKQLMNSWSYIEDDQT